jgi:hypothetical protein
MSMLLLGGLYPRDGAGITRTLKQKGPALAGPFLHFLEHAFSCPLFR